MHARRPLAHAIAGFKDSSDPLLAEFSNPKDIVFDAEGSMLVCDHENARIRKIGSKSGAVTTVAGIGKMGYNGDVGVGSWSAACAPFSGRRYLATPVIAIVCRASPPRSRRSTTRRVSRWGVTA